MNIHPMVPDRFLIRLALRVLEETAQKAKTGPLERTYAVRLCLAYLASKSPERWPFDEYLRELVQEDDKMRSANLSRTLNAIHLRLGIGRKS
ncbi:MAG: hypothetical protein ABJO88_09695 [Parasphingorhabdus sp.]